MSTPSLTTLFEESCDPHSYIPRRAGEEILRCLSALIRDGEPAIVLHGPSGIGKTMLLRVLAERFEDERRVAYVSLTDAPAPELTHRVLDALSEPATDDPARALSRAAAAASSGQPRLLLLIDHANLAPIASSLQLVSAAKKASPHLTVIFAVADEEGAEEFARALSIEVRVTTLCFDQSMDSKEATAYVRLRLARSEVPAELREQLDDRAMTWLSEGARAALPREINRRAAELLRSYEEDGEAALETSIDEAASPSPADPPSPASPKAIDPADIPRGASVEPNPPSFPMSRTGDGGAGAQGSGGSLGGMLLGHGPGARPNFEIDLELGRSLSSGLLESPAAKKPTRDGQPVPPPPPQDEGASKEQPLARPAETENRPVLWVVASLTTLLMLGGFYLMLSATDPEPAANAQDGAAESDRFARIGEPVAPASPAVAPPTPAVSPPSTIAPDEEVRSPSPATGAPTPAAPEESTSRPSLVAGPMLDPVTARNAELQEEQARAAAAQIARAESSPAPPARRNASPARPKGPIVLQSGRSAELTHPGSYARLMIDVEPGAEIFVDGKSIGRAPLEELFVEMGLHTFSAELPDGVVVEQLVEVEIGTEVVEF